MLADIDEVVQIVVQASGLSGHKTSAMLLNSKVNVKPHTSPRAALALANLPPCFHS